MMCLHIEPITIESFFTTDRILVIFAMVLSLFGLGYSMFFNRRTLILTKDHNKKMVTPALVFERGSGADERFVYSCSIKNSGFGPAIIDCKSLLLATSNSGP
mgnify:CR=1 FL=1